MEIIELQIMFFLEECENCSVFGKEKLIIGFGIKDLVLVDAGDVILVMDKGRDQEIKHLLNSISGKKELKNIYKFINLCKKSPISYTLGV